MQPAAATEGYQRPPHPPAHARPRPPTPAHAHPRLPRRHHGHTTPPPWSEANKCLSVFKYERNQFTKETQDAIHYAMGRVRLPMGQVCDRIRGYSSIYRPTFVPPSLSPHHRPTFAPPPFHLRHTTLDTRQYGTGPKSTRGRVNSRRLQWGREYQVRGCADASVRVCGCAAPPSHRPSIPPIPPIPLPRHPTIPHSHRPTASLRNSLQQRCRDGRRRLSGLPKA